MVGNRTQLRGNFTVNFLALVTLIHKIHIPSTVCLTDCKHFLSQRNNLKLTFSRRPKDHKNLLLR